MCDVASMTREKQEEVVWLTAYVRALRKLDPVKAEVTAIDALRRFRTRWIGADAPPGVDPRVYEMARSAGEDIAARGEIALARLGPDGES